MKDKILFVLLFICMVLLSLTYVIAFSSNQIAIYSGTCFQNLSNVSSSCGGLNTGNYSDRTPSNWLAGNEAQYFYDGDFNTYARAKVSSGAEIKFYYTIPNNATGATMNIKLGSTHYDNITIPASCYNWTYFLYFDIVSSTTAGGGSIIYCATSLSTYTSMVSYVGQPNLYEATITWDMPNQLFNNTIENLTFTTNQNKTRYLLVPSNTLLTNAYMNLTGYSDSSGNNITNTSIWIGNINIFNQSGEYLLTGTIPASYKKLDSLETFSGDQGITSAQIQSQAFNSTSTYQVGMIGVPADKMLTNPRIGVEIQYANGTGYPNGSIVTYNYSWNSAEVTAGSSIVWYNVTVPNVTLVQNQMYAVIYRWISGGSINVGYKNSVRSATEGKYQSVNNGTNWTGPETASIGFRIYNYTAPIPGTVASNITSNFANIVNDYLSGCVYVGSYCYVPITFHSDTAGILNYQNLVFNNSAFIENNQDYNEYTSSGTIENFNINITYDSLYYNSINVYLVYNSTNYLITPSGVGNTKIFSRTINIPEVDLTTNKTFYYSIQLTNSTGTYLYNSTSNTQQINLLYIDNCTVNNRTLFNFTMIDEESLSTINGTIQAVVNIYTSNTTNLIASYNKTLVFGTSTPASICVNNISSSYDLTYELKQIVNSSYFEKSREIQKFLLTNSTPTQNIILYNLLTASGYQFSIQILGNIYGSNNELLVEAQKLYIPSNTFNLVESSSTGNDGKTILSLVQNTETYNFIVSKDGVILGTFNNYKVQCSNPLTYSCTLLLNLAQSTADLTDFDNYGNITYLYTIDKTSNTIYLTGLSTDGNNHNITMQIVKGDNYGNTSVCTSSIVGISGTIVCAISGNYVNTTLFSNLFSDGIFIGTTYITSLGTDIEDLKLYGVDIIIELLMFCCLVMLFLAHPILIVIGTVLGVTFAIVLIFVTGSSWGALLGSLGYLIVLGGIILWQVSRRV
jgi:hypothetical protein